MASGTVAITGANSAVGTALLARVADQDALAAVALVRRPEARDGLPASPRITVEVARYDEPERLTSALSGADSVVHLAGTLFESRTTRYGTANVEATRALVAAAQAAGVPHVVFVSSLGADPHVTNGYFRSKGEAERLLAESGLDATIIRTPLLLGPGTAGGRALRRTAEQRSVRVLGGGAHTLRPLDVDDLCDAVLRCCAQPPAGVQTHELVGPEALRYRELLERTARRLGHEISIRSTPVLLAKLGAGLAGLVRTGGVTRDVIDVITSDETIERNADADLGIRLTPLSDTLSKLCGPPHRETKSAAQPAMTRIRTEPAMNPSETEHTPTAQPSGSTEGQRPATPSPAEAPASEGRAASVDPTAAAGPAAAVAGPMAPPDPTASPAADAAPPGRSRAGRAAFLAIGIACFAYLAFRLTGAAEREGLSLADYMTQVFRDVRWGPWIALMVGYSGLYFLIDTLVVSRALTWFIKPIRYRDILPIRASAYIISIFNEQIGKGAMAYYLHRRDRVPGWEVGSVMLFVMFCEVYYLLLWAAVGFAFSGGSLPPAFGLVPWLAAGAVPVLIVWLLYFRGALTPGLRLRERRIFHAFRQASLRHYALFVLLRSPALLAAVGVYTVALNLFGVEASFLSLLGYLPVVFFAAAVPTPMRAAAITFWVILFPENEGQMAAFGFVQHNFFILFNALIGVAFWPRAQRELFG